MARSRLLDFVELTKPRISVMVLFTVAAAGYAASHAASWNPWGIIHAIFGTFLIAASGSALNMYLERWFDARMKRTSGRPLPAGRLSSMDVLVFGTMTFCAGSVYLFTTLGWLPGVLGVTTWVLYVWIYTPMKRMTWLNTIVGAVAGAMPILIGWTATTPEMGWLAFAMFGVLFLWQFPHFMAISWIYRSDYADGSMKMLPVVDPSGRSAAWEAIIAAALILPISLIPTFALEDCPVWFPVLAIVLGAGYLSYSIKFRRHINDQTARHLLRFSLIYLPLYLAALMFTI